MTRRDELLVDSVFMKSVDSIWANYDKEGTGWLDKKQLRVFVYDLFVYGLD